MSSTGAAAPRPCICIGWPGQRRRAYEAATRRRQRSALCGAARMGAAAAAIPAMQVTAAELTRAGSSCIAITIGTLYGNEKAYGVWLKLLYYAEYAHTNISCRKNTEIMRGPGAGRTCHLPPPATFTDR